MTENFLSKAMADGQVFVKLVNLVGNLSKLKLQIHKQRGERDRLIKDVGASTIRVCHQMNSIDGPAILDAVSAQLHSLKDVDANIINLEQQVSSLRSNFKQTPTQAPGNPPGQNPGQGPGPTP